MGSFENDLKDMFDGVEYQLSEKVWAGVEKAIQQKNKGIFFMWQTYGVAASLALLASVGFLYKGGYFDQPVDPKINKQLTELKENQSDNDSLKLLDQTIDKPIIDVVQQADNINTPSRLITPSILTNELGSSNTLVDNVSNSSILKSGGEGVVELTVDKMMAIELAQPKAYRFSLAANQAAWFISLGVDPSDLKTLSAELVDQPTSNGEMSISGRLGNNSLNMTSSTDMLNAQGIQDARFAAFSDLSNQEERALGAISAGAGVSIPLSDRLYLNTSLRYTEFRSASTSNGYAVENGKSLPIYVPLGYDPDNVNFTGTYNLTNTIQGFSIQPTLSYQVAKFGPFDISVTGGFAVDYLFSYRIKGDLNFLSVRKVDFNDAHNFNDLNVSSVTGLSVNYRINQSFGFGVDLNYRYFIPMNQQSGRSQTSVLGFGLGVNYFLNRRED